MNDETQTPAKFDYAFPAEEAIILDAPWHDDVFGRQKPADYLTGLVKGAEDSPFVISVNGEWGSGKTFFCNDGNKI